MKFNLLFLLLAASMVPKPANAAPQPTIIKPPPPAYGGNQPYAVYGGQHGTKSGETVQVTIVVARKNVDSADVTGQVVVGSKRYDIKGTIKNDGIEVDEKGRQTAIPYVQAQFTINGKTVRLYGPYLAKNDLYSLTFSNGWGDLSLYYVPPRKKSPPKPPKKILHPKVAPPEPIKPPIPPVPPKNKPKPPPVKPKAVATWGLVEVVNDPDHLTRSEGDKYISDETELRINHYRKDYVTYDDPEKTSVAQDYHFNVRLDTPPLQIKSGQPFELTVQATCTSSKHTLFMARWGWYSGGIEAKLVRAGKSSSGEAYKGQVMYVGLDEKLGFEPTATGVYLFKPTDILPNEFTINQNCDGKLATFKIKKGATPTKVLGDE